MTPQLAQASIFYVNSTFPLFKVSIREGKNVVLTLKLKAFRRMWGAVPLFFSQKIIYGACLKLIQLIERSVFLAANPMGNFDIFVVPYSRRGFTVVADGIKKC